MNATTSQRSRSQLRLSPWPWPIPIGKGRDTAEITEPRCHGWQRDATVAGKTASWRTIRCVWKWKATFFVQLSQKWLAFDTWFFFLLLQSEVRDSYLLHGPHLHPGQEMVQKGPTHSWGAQNAASLEVCPFPFPICTKSKIRRLANAISFKPLEKHQECRTQIDTKLYKYYFTWAVSASLKFSPLFLLSNLLHFSHLPFSGEGLQCSEGKETRVDSAYIDTHWWTSVHIVTQWYTKIPLSLIVYRNHHEPWPPTSRLSWPSHPQNTAPKYNHVHVRRLSRLFQRHVANQSCMNMRLWTPRN